jgi:hypothetical protein
MPLAVEILARPFAAFFEEAFASRCALAPVRPRADTVGIARLPVRDDFVRLDLCCECLRPHDECCCD